MGRVHLDLTGELPETDLNGNKYIMVVKDFMTKYVWIFAIPNKEAETVADILVSEIYCVFGAPQSLVTDNGAEFKNRLNNRLSKLYRVNKIHTTPYVPRSNGLVEQHNRTLKDQLYHFVNTQHSDWDQYLATLQLMYNTTVNAATGMTPMWCMFGREASGPDVEGLKDIDFTDRGAKEANPLDQWVDKLQRSLQVAWEVVTDRSYYNQIRMNGSRRHWEWMRSAAGSTGGGRRALEFKEYETGQLFYRRRCPVRTFTSASAKEKHKISAKLQARFDGPYKVTGRVNAVVYWADINGEETRVHAMNMKPQNALTTQTTLQRQDKEAEKEEKGGGARAPRARGFTDIEDID
jgi:transposase InsO family protein